MKTIQTNIPIPKGFEEAYKKRKDYPKIKKIIRKIKSKGGKNDNARNENNN